jgi:hypothetical protein
MENSTFKSAWQKMIATSALVVVLNFILCYITHFSASMVAGSLLLIVFYFTIKVGRYLRILCIADYVVIHKPFAIFSRTYHLPLTNLLSVEIEGTREFYFRFNLVDGSSLVVNYCPLEKGATEAFGSFLTAHAIKATNFFGH